MQNGLESSRYSFENGETDCPNCDGKNTLEYKMEMVDLDDTCDHQIPLEGLVCSDCGDMFMSNEQTVKYLNAKSAMDRTNTRFTIFDGRIVEGTIN